VSMSC